MGATPEQLGMWILGAGALIGFLSSIVALIAGMQRLLQGKPLSQQPLTRAEATRFATRAELQRLGGEVKEVKDMVDKSQAYMQSRFHELTNSIAPMPTQIAVIAKQLDKIDQRQERMNNVLEGKPIEEKPE